MHETYDLEARTFKKADSYPVRLGIIGGGQLARMTALAALPLGCEVVVLEKNAHSPAARLSPDSVVGDWSNSETLLKFAKGCAVVTLENEFVDSAALELLEKAGHKVFPSAACVALTQDKWKQKRALQGAGIRVPNFRAVGSADEIMDAGREFGWPLVLKTRRNGYDGKGNFTVGSPADVERGWGTLHGDANELMVECFYPFVKELAVIVTRAEDGTVAVYPVVETVQREHVCRLVKAPAQIPTAIAQDAVRMAQKAVEAVGGVGSFGVEMFLSATGELAVNELAPRVHNSGHYTIEACRCSQFENHVRAVLGWPLGDPAMVTPAAVMVNLLGTSKALGKPVGLESALKVGGARVHLYGKMMSGPGRKMGHITALGESIETALSVAEKAAGQIHFGVVYGKAHASAIAQMQFGH